MDATQTIIDVLRENGFEPLQYGSTAVEEKYQMSENVVAVLNSDKKGKRRVEKEGKGNENGKA